ncbi:MAG: DNA/RNA nuclease SfsA [Oscillospiraceae bacterium]|nr:DNA/RNA nuclease SfsA [Oscillospiraceae bacterium]MBR4691150.1 DNA/RNA nuclease SfsA [Oscillospiraceae bacterium]
MRYPKVCEARFLDRPNRFVAHVSLAGETVAVHVKNTGRCRELLLPGVRVLLTPGETPGRKTAWDLVGVYKNDERLFNIDSQAPNRAVGEWLRRQPFSEIRPEAVFGSSRIDFAMVRGEERWLLEVKGCTLEKDGVGWFPDAPTLRGAKHLRELTAAAGEGYRCAVAFVIQTEGVTRVLPNGETDPAFAEALAAAERAGVRILSLPCRVTPELLEIPDRPEDML